MAFRLCESGGCVLASPVQLSPTDRKRLRVIVDDRNSPQKHVWRARIVLATADGLGTAEIMHSALGYISPAEMERRAA